MPKLEIIATCVDDVIAAREGGADRVELVSALSEGGLTPSYGLIERAVRERGHIQIMTMIRPHAMGFVYSAHDLEIMCEDIKIARSLGCDGVVFGALTHEGKVDFDATNRLLKATHELDVTFHRAFDKLAHEDKLEAYKALTALPIDNLLTSSWDFLKDSDGLQILAGGGMTLEKIPHAVKTGADVHFGTAVRRDGKILEPIEVELVRKAKERLNGSV